MIVDADYFYQGVLRWNLGWATPNYAGAFLTTLLPWCWITALRSALYRQGFGAQGAGRRPVVGGPLAETLWRVGGRRIWPWGLVMAVVFGVELGLWFCLAKTYSRGGLCAALTAWVFVAMAWWGHGAAVRWRLAASLLMAGGVTVATGLGARMAAPVTVGDAAVTNRIDLWKAGTEMIAAAPWRGWGAGESGRTFMNWFQEIDRSEGYTTTVNSYLHVGVEHGLIALGVVLAALFGLLTVAWSCGRASHAGAAGGETGEGPDSGILSSRFQPFVAALQPLSLSAFSIAAGAAIVAWAVANVFSTLWIEPLLWAVPSLAAGIILISLAFHRANLRLPLVTALASGVVCVVLLWSAGSYLAQSRSLRIEPLGQGEVLVTRKAAGADAAWEIWPDGDVLGRTFGKEIRRWADTPGAPQKLIVRNPHRSDAPLAGRNGQESGLSGLMLFGQQAERLGEIESGRFKEIVLVHPHGRPAEVEILKIESERGPTITMLLPEIDQRGDQVRWRKWAAATGARVVTAEGVGHDIRAVWPAVMVKALGERRREESGGATVAWRGE